TAPANPVESAEQEKPLIDAAKLELYRQMIRRKNWTPEGVEVLLKEFGILNENRITEASLPDILNRLIAGPGLTVPPSGNGGTTPRAAEPAETKGKAASDKLSAAETGKV